MKLIEADKVEQAIKDYWKAQVDRLPIPKSIEEHDTYANRLGTILEYNSDLLKEIEALPSAEPDTTTHDSIPAETGENDGDRTSGDCISRQQAIDVLEKMQTYKLFAGDDMLLIDQAEAQTELMMLPSAQIEPESISKWKKEFREYVDSLDIARDDWKGIIEYIDELPSMQPERKTGRWIDAVLPNDNGGLPVQVCDQCNTFFPLAYTGGGHHFCPNCGAKMEGGEQK